MSRRTSRQTVFLRHLNQERQACPGWIFAASQFMRLVVASYRKRGLLIHFSLMNFSVEAEFDSLLLRLSFKVTHHLLFKVSLSLIVYYRLGLSKLSVFLRR